MDEEMYGFLNRVYSAGSTDESRAAYDEWASKYDTHLAQENYLAPTLIAQAVLSRSNQINGPILDAACGTGLLGIALRQQIVEAGKNQGDLQFEVDGVDLSPGMLKVAEKTGVYRNLSIADLTQPLVLPDSTYGAVTCVGTLTPGHLGPTPVLREFVRVVKTGGIVAVTVLEPVWEKGGFAEEFKALRKEDLVEEFAEPEKVQIGERDGHVVYARIVVIRKK